jgi:peptide deformylase
MNRKNKPVICINPEITMEDGVQFVSEGCLSVPNFTVLLKRAKELRMSYIDEYGIINENVLLKGKEASIAQHEVDHLNGITILDRAGEKTKKYYDTLIFNSSKV